MLRPRYRTVDNEKIDLMRQGHLSVISLMYYEMTDATNQLRREYAEVLSEYVNTLSAKQLMQLDSIFRSRESLEWYMDWGSFNPKALFTPDMSNEQKITLLGLGSFHPNGFYREKCLRMLGDYPLEYTVQFVLLRMNDWVPKISALAKEMFFRYIHSLNVETLIRNMPFVMGFEKKNRVDNRDAIQECLSILSASENLPTVLDMLKKEENDDVKKICYELISRANTLDMEFISERIHMERSPYLRVFFLQKMLPRIVAAGNRDFLCGLLSDKLIPIRNIALDGLYQIDPANSHMRILVSLSDKSMSVRESARYYIAKQVDFDFRKFYIQAIQAKPSCGDILGLAETGVKEDATMLLPFLESAETCIVKAAMIAVMKLDRQKYTGHMVLLLSDSRAGISKQAFKLLMKTDISTYEHDIYSIFKNAVSNYMVRNHCARLLTKLDKWRSIHYIAEFLLDGDERLVEYGNRQLDIWLIKFNKSFTKPTPLQWARVQAMAADGRLPERLTKYLGFLIK